MNSSNQGFTLIEVLVALTLLGLIAEPYSTMVYVAVYTGLRISELVGLRWRDVHPDSITVEERVAVGIGEHQKARQATRQFLVRTHDCTVHRTDTPNRVNCRKQACLS